MSGPVVADILDDALARFARVRTYEVTLRSAETPGGPSREVIRYAYRKPGWVRMDFIRPRPGMVLIYDPEQRVVRLWPFGANGPDFSVSPENWLLTSAGGHRVDRSDLGALLAHAAALRSKGAVEVLGEEPIEGRRTVHVRVLGAGDETVDKVHRFDLWLDTDSLMPLQAEGYGLDDMPVDIVQMDDLALDANLPDNVFTVP